jgi:hypothetical protein
MNADREVSKFGFLAISAILAIVSQARAPALHDHLKNKLHGHPKIKGDAFYASPVGDVLVVDSG